nr:reverse transcriptase domain-containing protein [Tanacetum cinerariifolium]
MEEKERTKAEKDPKRVPFEQRNNPPQHPRVGYPPILDISYFRHFLITLQNRNPMDDEPIWAVDRVVALTSGSAITIPKNANEFAIKDIDKILEEDFDALLDEGSEILYSIEGTILEEKLFAEFDEFMAMTVDENSKSESDTEEPPFETITFNTDYKIKTYLEEPPTDLDLKPLPNNLEYTIMHTDLSALRHLFKKQDAKLRLIRWILLLQEFDFEIKDRKGTENVAADHLSRIKNDKTSDESIVDDNFPRETLMEMNTEDEPWFTDFANYLVSDIIPKGMTFLALGWHLQEIHVTWNHLEKKQKDHGPTPNLLKIHAYRAWRRHNNSNDDEVLNELIEYENVGVLCREREINSFDGDDLACQCMIEFRKFVTYFDPFLPMNIITRKAYNTIMVEGLESTGKNLVIVVGDVYVFVGSFTYITDFVVLEDKREFIQINKAEVVMGKPF